MDQAITRSACHQWARKVRKLLRDKGVGAIGRVGTRRDRERDTGKSAGNGVSRREMAGKERMRVSDTGKMAKKGVSRTE